MDGIVQERRDSIANAPELHLSFTNLYMMIYIYTNAYIDDIQVIKISIDVR